MCSLSLSHNTISSSYNKDSTIHLSCTSDHVLYIVSMAWAVNVCVMSLCSVSILNVSCRDCDSTLSLFRSFIDISQSSAAVLPATLAARTFVIAAVRCCFTMVNVSNGTNVTMRFGSFKLSFCHFKTSSLICAHWAIIFNLG